ncbi:MAG: phosphate ABC transporter permease PstA [Bdellovibrionaceae bacterium]|nr:phosphate ABC transporter permease PstA [Pseudobdellovibrionaceae bacterium]MDW8190291.1 phosphate ABC transporter permease PstA [Pseudobdellovibrionaceae bacterium]
MGIFSANKSLQDRIFLGVSVVVLIFVLGIIFALFGGLINQGLDRLNWDFMFSFPSRNPQKAGIYSAWVGSILVILVTAICSVIIGVITGLYLEEYAPKNWMTQIIELAIANMAGVPSITFGLLALSFFVIRLDFGESILTAGLTLTLLVLPIIIVATRESLRSIPLSIREAVYSLGASRYQVIRDHLLPYSLHGILTGVILAISRAIGETAPLIAIGALTFIAFLPQPPLEEQFPFVNFDWLFDNFTVLPIQMYNWISRPQEKFHVNAAATGIVLLIITTLLNLMAQIIRFYFRKKYSRQSF